MCFIIACTNCVNVNGAFSMINKKKKEFTALCNGKGFRSLLVIKNYKPSKFLMHSTGTIISQETALSNNQVTHSLRYYICM